MDGTMTKRVLVIEDDAKLGAQVVEHLRRGGYEPAWARDGNAIVAGERPEAALVILDLMLPGAHGFDVLKALRAGSEVPVLVLSARVDTHDKVRALALGADDYLTKPFWPEELMERVRARLRRPVLARGNVLEVGALRIDLATREVWIAGRAVELTRVELDLLAALARRPGAAVTRQWLADHVLDPERDGTDRNLDAHMSRLRKKLGSGTLIRTVWGIGYRLAAEDET
jgi:two-component system response regulator MtrA